MSKVNIPSYIQDPSYRYKMPKMVLKQESRLNGVKTNVFNLDEIAKSLRVPEEAILKFWCAELGASAEKKSIIKGQHNFDTLQKILDKFIEKYLLCNKCKYPETSMYVKQKNLQSKCRACGTINNLDSIHRSGVLLMKNLPKNMSEIDGQNNTDSQQDGKKSKKTKDGEESKIEEEPLKKKKKADEEALASVQEATTIDSEEVLGVIEKVSNLLQDGATPEKVLEEAQKTLVSLGISNEFRYYVLICGIFTPDRNIVKNWPSFEKIFLQLISQDGKIGIKHLFQSIIQLFMNKYTELQKYAPTFMKLLYDQEVFDDELIIGWFEKKIKLDKTCALYDRKAERHFRKLIVQFVDWLKTSQEEEDEDEEEEEEEEEEEKTSSISPQKNDQETEQQRKQKELIQKQMQEQQKMIDAKKEEALNKALTETTDRVNVMDIDVEDDFDVDDI